MDLHKAPALKSVVDPQNKSLEVRPLRVKGIDWVVRGLMEPVKNPHSSPRLDGGSHNGVGEQKVVHGLAA